MKIDEAGRKRAAAALRRRTQGQPAQWIADRASISDASTVRAFLDGETWPRSGTRRKLEATFGMEPGELEAIARDEYQDRADATDPVIAAIDRSPLHDWRKDVVRAEYRRNLFEQERDERGRGA